MALHAFKGSLGSWAALSRFWPRCLVWPAAAYAVFAAPDAGAGALAPAVAGVGAFALVAAVAALPLRREPVTALVETLLAGLVVALAGGSQSPWLLLFPWLALDYGARGGARVMIFLLIPPAYLAGTGWAEGGLPGPRLLALHAMVFVLAAFYAALHGRPDPEERPERGYAGFGARKEDRLLSRALQLFSHLAGRDDQTGAAVAPEFARGARALARVLPLFAEGDDGAEPTGVTFRRFEPAALVEAACRDWSACAGVRGLDLQGFVAPSAQARCFGDSGRTGEILDLMLFAGCFAVDRGSLMLELDLQEGEVGGCMILTLRVSGRRDAALNTAIVGAALRKRADRLGGRHIATGAPDDATWRVELPFDLELGNEEPARRLAGVTLHVTGDSPLRPVLEAYIQAEEGVLVDDPAQARAILLAEPARDPETEARCQALKRAWPRLPLLCQGSTAGTPAALMLESDAVIPVPFTRADLVRLVTQELDIAESRRHQGASGASTLSTSAEPAEGHPDSSRRSILVAEDDAISARVVSRFLEAEGCRVYRVRDGEAALDALKRDRPALALLDMHMPGLGGVEVADRLRAWEQGQGEEPVVLVALTASAADADRRACREAGMDDFLSKPVDREALRELLDRFRIGSIPEEKPE